MTRSALTMTAMVAALAAATPAAAANTLVANGDFEAGLAGWSVVPGGLFGTQPDILAIKGQAYISNAGGTGSPAAAANTMASFGSGDRQNISVLLSNAFDTVAGKSYRVSFDYAQFGGTAGSQVLRYAIIGTGITGTAGTTGTNTQVGGTNLDTIFQRHVNFFVGSGSPANIMFTLFGSSSAGADGLLDNVVITAVPESSTWMLFILGFGAIGAAYRRRKSMVAFA